MKPGGKKRHPRKSLKGKPKHQTPSVDAESQLKRWAILEERTHRGRDKNPKEAIKKILKRSAVKKERITKKDATESVVGTPALMTDPLPRELDDHEEVVAVSSVSSKVTKQQRDRGRRVKDRAKELRAQLLGTT